MSEEMKKICEFLESRGYVSVSTPGYHIQIYKKGNILVKVEDRPEKKNGP
jgi:predicted RNA binding protein YcfA (HicA-like mRNA interferase family)